MSDKTKDITSLIRVRISEADVHYAGGLVDGAKILQFFGDAATEILIKNDGDEGLFRAYDDVEFLSPVRAGDYLEIKAKLQEIGTSSRWMTFEAAKVIEGSTDPKNPTRARVLSQPVLVARASGTCVVPSNKSNKKK